MKKANRWSHGVRDFVLPLLPQGFKGRHGCRLHRLTFDTTIGEEVCAVYMEEPGFADRYGNVEPFNLVVNYGLVRTPHGVVAFIVWQVAAKSRHEVLVEQYLNPQNIGTVRLVASAANQSHFKLLVINNESTEVTAFVDFENVFQFDRLASAMALGIGHEPEGDFDAAMQHVMAAMTVQELVALSAIESHSK